MLTYDSPNRTLTLYTVLYLALFLASCSSAPTSAPETVPAQLYHRVQNGETLVPATITLALPANIHPAQLKKQFRLNQDSFALALQSSSNVPLDTGQIPAAFAGILYAPAGATAWTPIFEVTSSDPSAKNNPYWLSTENKSLYLTVVDQNGAGSGEGVMKVLRLDPQGEWKLEACYYFGSRYNSPETDGDYFEFSSRHGRQQSLPLDQCAAWGSLQPIP